MQEMLERKSCEGIRWKQQAGLGNNGNTMVWYIMVRLLYHTVVAIQSDISIVNAIIQHLLHLYLCLTI